MMRTRTNFPIRSVNISWDMTVAICLIPLLKILLHSVGHVCMCAQSLQSGPTLCEPMDSSPLGSSVPGILQARLLEWVVMPPPGNLPHPGIEFASPALQADSLLLSRCGSPVLATGAIKPYMKRPRGTPWSMSLSLRTNFNCLAKWELSLYLTSF